MCLGYNYHRCPTLPSSICHNDGIKVKVMQSATDAEPLNMLLIYGSTQKESVVKLWGSLECLNEWISSLDANPELRVVIIK